MSAVYKDIEIEILKALRNNLREGYKEFGSELSENLAEAKERIEVIRSTGPRRGGSIDDLKKQHAQRDKIKKELDQKELERFKVLFDTLSQKFNPDDLNETLYLLHCEELVTSTKGQDGHVVTYTITPKGLQVLRVV